MRNITKSHQNASRTPVEAFEAAIGGSWVPGVGGESLSSPFEKEGDSGLEIGPLKCRAAKMTLKKTETPVRKGAEVSETGSDLRRGRSRGEPVDSTDSGRGPGSRGGENKKRPKGDERQLDWVDILSRA